MPPFVKGAARSAGGFCSATIEREHSLAESLVVHTTYNMMIRK